LKDKGFCNPIIDEAAVAAKKKKEMEAEVERVKKEFEEKQKKKKEREKEKEKDKKDDVKKDDDGEKKSDEKVSLLYMLNQPADTNYEQIDEARGRSHFDAGGRAKDLCTAKVRYVPYGFW
jgi:hypothetical protein